MFKQKLLSRSSFQVYILFSLILSGKAASSYLTEIMVLIHPMIFFFFFLYIFVFIPVIIQFSVYFCLCSSNNSIFIRFFDFFSRD